MAATRFRSLDAVNRAIVQCERCPRLITHCRAVAAKRKREFRDWDYWGKPVPGFGDPDARLVIVGLAPAAHGANRTGRMFTGDSSGDWLYDALHRFGFASRAESTDRDDGLALTNCYITASARCAQPSNKPRPDELANCRQFLEADLALLHRTTVVLLLGRIAWRHWLEASGWWARLSVGDRPQFGHGETTMMPDGRTVVCSYHPSRQNTNTGRLTREMWYGVFSHIRTLIPQTRLSNEP
jgi:uracil-DNA glycosylase family 4